jgi:hypothetical protein
LRLFIKHRQRLAPGRLLFVVDFAEIDNGSLHRLAGNQAMVFYDAEAAMIVSSEADDEAEKRPQLRKSG